jgi:hypothetical protein
LAAGESKYTSLEPIIFKGKIMALTTPVFREDFEFWAKTGAPPLESPPLAAAALMSHAAFAQPERQIAIFDAIASAWLDLDSARHP